MMHILQKITDFGDSRPINRVTYLTYAGTKEWTAPEVLSIKTNLKILYDFPVDVYSFGIIMWELLEMKAPYANEQINIFSEVKEGRRPNISNDQNYDDYLSLMKLCWNGDSSKRPTFNQIVSQLQDMNTQCQETIVWVPIPQQKIQNANE